MSSPHYDVVILGAGAAGMMCAFQAGRRGRRVLLLERGLSVGRKILISGGGRCNFTNLHTRADNFLSSNPHFAKSALARYSPADFVALVERHGIRYHEKTLGQLFCDGSARQIVALLERECAEAGVETRCGVEIVAVQQAGLAPAGTGPAARENPKAARFLVHTRDATGGGEIACESLVVATGGLSIPRMGATGFGYELARQFGHAVVAPRPGLVPLVFAAEDRERWCDLAGVATEVVARADASAPFRERLLVTHRGVSGPAVLQVSSFWRPGETVSFDLAPGQEVVHALRARNARRDVPSLTAALRSVLPARFAERWVVSRTAWDWTNAGLDRLERELHAWTLRPEGSEGFAKAEVTVGGVDTREVDARTLESRRVPGLHFVGEVLDVTGWLGGYNFQWAWASAVAAGAVV